NDVYSRRVPIFLCPSDPSVGADGVVEAFDGFRFGASCYGPNALVSGNADLTTRPYKLDPQGRTRLHPDIMDGTSHTILYAEKYPRCTNTWMAPQFREGGTTWAYCANPTFPWQPPPMKLPVKMFLPGFCIAALANQGAPYVLGPESKFQVQP